MSTESVAAGQAGNMSTQTRENQNVKITGIFPTVFLSVATAGLLGVGACASAPAGGGTSASGTGTEADAGEADIVADTVAADSLDERIPPGFGRLHQEDFTVSLRAGPLQLKVTPLAESVIRLAAPDTYDRLHAVAESRREQARLRTMTDQPRLFLISFFSYQPDVTFEADDIRISQRGRLYRPLAVLPITSGWGSQQLQQQDSESAVYVFDEDIDLDADLAVEYGMERSDRWESIIRELERERSRVRSRAGF